MDIAVHWGVFRYIRKEINANAIILISAIVFDIVVLATFLAVKAQTDIMVIYTAIVGMVVIFAGERFFLRANNSD